MIHRRLRPVRPPDPEIQAIEKRLKRLWLDLVYRPLLKGENISEAIRNEAPTYPGLELALSSGRLTYYNGVFSGKFNAAATKELKQLGAKWNYSDHTFHLPKDKLPAQITRAINTSETRFVQKLNALDAELVQILDKNVWKRFVLTDLFDKSIFRMDKEFRKNVETISIQPPITGTEAKAISEEWQGNLERGIEDFTKKQIQELREKIKESYFKGDRYGSLIQGIQKSYRITERKAEFLAQQETQLLTATYQGTRYVEAGIPGYFWKAVTGSAAHPVRHRHRELSDMSDRGKVFYWNKPPVTTEPGQPVRRNNPGQDFRCRCSAIPVVEGKK